MRLLTTIFLSVPAVVHASAYDRPIPQTQSATAEFWFALATISFCLVLYAVHRMVARR